MQRGIEALTERERDTLRLLLAGHDAKSIASLRGLSVHTINERLRDARRKLNVTSSRQAARLLSEAEHDPHNSLGDSEFGVSADQPGLSNDALKQPRRASGYRLAWFTGGMFIMSLIVAAAMLLPALQGSSPVTAENPAPATAATRSISPAETAALDAARAWLALTDAGRWQESWQMAAATFRSRISGDQWTAAIKPARTPLGAVSSRSVRSAARTRSLPGVPAGDYVVILFETAFARSGSAVETVTLVHEGGQWRVAGYYIR